MTFDVRSLLRPADILLIVPPFAWQDRPALGVHLLQALAREAGLEAQVLYSNFLFTAFFDEGTHNTVAQMQYGLYLGERLFVRAARGGPPLGRDGGAGIVPTLDALAAGYQRMGVATTFTLPAILAVEARIPAWIDSVIAALAPQRYRIVGSTSSFEQTLSSIAMLTAIKRASPATTVILGGANCEGELAEGVRALGPAIDHVFSGESERTFVEFLRGEHSEPIIVGTPCEQLDALPTPDYADYFDQLHAVIPDSDLVRRRAMHLTYETSRGCWWGEKSHCTFCGLNGQGMASRDKSPDRVIGDLTALVARHGVPRVVMTDNIMPHAYFRTVLPRLARELPGVRIMYEEKANLRLEQVQALVSAGIVEIQPGIEALSTGLLRLMAKGTTAAQNLALLRYARATGLLVQWNLLLGFPGDELAFYLETLELLPLIHHLQPPVSPCPVVIDRFSPYFEHPERYGITELRPFAFYRGVYEDDFPLAKLAYHFEGTYACATRDHPEIVKQIGDAVAIWRRRFYGPAAPRLSVVRDANRYLLIDTREVAGNPVEQWLDEAQAIAVLTSRPARAAARQASAWALAHKLIVERDGKLIPLATAEPELLAELEARAARPADLLRAIG